MGGKVESKAELKALLQRQMSGRTSETTFDAPQHDASSVEKKVQVKEDKAAMKDVLQKAGKRALGGGLPGAAAMGIQVTTLMWMRTTMNYQYRHGTSTFDAFRHLYKEGGIRRFYRGYGPAILQAPLSRFGDTAANAGMLALLDSQEATAGLAPAVKTLFSSVAAGSFRI